MFGDIKTKLMEAITINGYTTQWISKNYPEGKRAILLAFLGSRPDTSKSNVDTRRILEYDINISMRGMKKDYDKISDELERVRNLILKKLTLSSLRYRFERETMEYEGRLFNSLHLSILIYYNDTFRDLSEPLLEKVIVDIESKT
jgi:hypothetical protein